MSAERVPGPMPGETTVLEEILAVFERGEDPDAASLKAAHPGKEDMIDRLLRAARRYFSAVHAEGSRRSVEPGLLPGERLGDFEIEAPLGRGGEGTVYRARQLSLGGRAIALKVFFPRFRTPLARARFEREAMVLADLHHPHLAEVHGFGEDRGLLFIAMRLVEGASLRAVQERIRTAGVLPPGRALRRALVGWIAEVADALSAVHAKRLVHRDVKPSNVIIEESGDPGILLPSGKAVLVDFGLVRPVGGPSLTRTGHGAATEEYAPPEQLVGSDVDARADVFALGTTLHDLLAGRVPGDRRQASAGLPPLESLLGDADRDLFAVVRKATELDPRRRYADAGAFHRDLLAWQAGREVSARRQDPVERVLRWARTHPRRLLKGTASAALALLLAYGVREYGRCAGIAGEARRAYESADLAAFARAAKALPPIARPFLLSDPALRRCVERIGEGATPDSHGLEVAVRHMEVGDFEQALLAAATDLRLNGPAADPLVERFFLSALRDDAAVGAVGQGQARRSAAIRLAARLLYESPAEDPPRLEEVAPLRKAVVHFPWDPTLPREDRLFALTALSGCGLPEDALWLLEWTLAQPASSEEMRLGLACCERIVRRSHRSGLLGRLDLPRLVDRARPLVSEALEGRWDWGRAVSRTELQFGSAVVNLAGAIGFARRARGEEVPWGEMIPARLDRAALEDGCAFIAGGTELFLVSRLEGIAERMKSGSPWTGLLTIPFCLGVACSLDGDEALARLARERIRGSSQEVYCDGYEDAGSAFEEGRLHGLALSRGENPPFRLDEDTLLGWVPREPEAERVLCSPSSGFVPPLSLSAAEWDFTVDPFVQRGAARTAVLRHGVILRGDHDRPILRMGRFGESELRLAFEVAAGDGNRRWRFDLGHVAAVRAYYPYSGEAFLEIRLDGKPIDGRFRVSGSDAHGRWWILPADLLAAGGHELTVHLGPETTTTYWVEEARLRPEA